MILQHPRDALNLAVIPLLGRLDLLGVVLGEPYRLAVVRALSAGLEEQPLLGEVRVVGSRCKRKLAGGVVGLGEVLEDGAGLPQREVSVGVVDGGHAAVGVDGEEGGLLQLGELRVDQLIRDGELFAEHAHFGRVGTMFAVDGDGLEGGGCGRHAGFLSDLTNGKSRLSND